ncbi:MAG: 4-(cytidine 5'-diphospho)-2-C-methyl-D-erythritol kinase [Zoogloeaceae bacterium]|nr:4-(cytidine 5'-diphospho)-2-C-methyl-D-erythritol kinase [Zoogloeaceae bacterium]
MSPAVEGLAPAKLNLFLHVVGRRPDGYHCLQTAFRMLDWGDWIQVRLRDDGRILRTSELVGVAAEEDLVVRAARHLQQFSGTRWGAEITVTKSLPLGGGVGGGSSDAATTLLLLNRLWHLGVDRQTLQGQALTLGADVPFFIFGRSAFAEGVGERLTPLPGLAPSWYVVVWPGVSVPTAQIFADRELTRNSVPIKIADFSAHGARNDLEPVARRLFPEVDAALKWLDSFGSARMTGSGACLFAAFASEELARKVVAQCPAPWRAWCAKSLEVHPLWACAED